MARHSPARWLAPLALVAFGFALYTVIGNGASDPGDETAAPAGVNATATPASKSTAKKSKSKTKYVVKLGDTPSQIAAETGVSLEEIERLNPDLDPQLLAPGEEIRLR